MNVLAVDLGRTTCRVALYSDGLRASVVRLDSGATLVDADGPATVTSMVLAAVDRLGGGTGVADAVVVAAAGAVFRPDAADELAGSLAAAGLRTREVVVTTDIVAAHAGALGGEPGVVLSAGTGAVAFAVAATGLTALVDGAGYLIGDDGSGFAVGRAGLGAAMRAHDGRPGGSPTLAREAVSRFGPLPELPGIVHGHATPARLVASFAPAVADAAREGDPVAISIWSRAVSDLVETAAAACDRLPEEQRRVAVTGSLFEIEDLVAEPFRDVLAERRPETVVRKPDGDALAGAATLAGGSATVYETLVIRRLS